MEAEQPLGLEPYECSGLVLPDKLEDRLLFTQTIRTMMLDKMTNGGTALPSTDDGIKLLLEVGRNMDAATLGEMRALTDAKTAQSGSIVAEAIMQLSQNRGKMLRVEVPTQRRVIPPSPELEGDMDLVPDETFIGQQSLTYGDMRERLGNDKK